MEKSGGKKSRATVPLRANMEHTQNPYLWGTAPMYPVDEQENYFMVSCAYDIHWMF
jgi:hypothetical protein